MVSKAVR